MTGAQLSGSLLGGPDAGRVPGLSAVPVARALAAGRPVRLAWTNELGGHTFEVGEDPERYFVKWTPAGSGLDLGREIAKLRWAAGFTPVPAVLDVGHDATGSWFVSAALPGTNAVADRWLSDPARAVAAIGAGLKALHTALPVASCPYTWSVADRVADAHRRAGRLDPAAWHAEHRRLSVDDALAVLRRPPEIDQLVVCSGDACAPNTLLDADGNWSAHVDLGALGVADRWADLAIATWSADWNYGPGWAEGLLAAYGIDPDPARTAYYRLLWDLGP